MGVRARFSPSVSINQGVSVLQLLPYTRFVSAPIFIDVEWRSVDTPAIACMNALRVSTGGAAPSTARADDECVDGRLLLAA